MLATSIRGGRRRLFAMLGMHLELFFHAGSQARQGGGWEDLKKLGFWA